MTSLTQLKKLAKDDLTPFLKEQGFKIVNTFDFIKEGPEEIYYVIFPIINRSENLSIHVVCYTAEMQMLIPKPFPKSISTMVGGELMPGNPIAYENGYIWKIETEEQAKLALKELKACIYESALPFFNSITDRQKLVDFIYPSLRHGDYDKVIKKILSWKPNN